MVFDALKSVEELQEAGIPETHAKAQVRLLQGVIESDLATKRDLEELRKATAHDLNEFRQATAHDLNELRQATAHDLNEFRQATARDLNELRQATAHDLNEFRQATKLDLKELELRLIVKLGTVVVGTGGLVIVVLSILSKFKIL